MRLRQPNRRHIDMVRALLLVVCAMILTAAVVLLAGALWVDEARAQSAPASPSVPPGMERGDVVTPQGARFDVFRSRRPSGTAGEVVPGAARRLPEPDEAARRSAVLGAPEASAARSSVLEIDPGGAGLPTRLAPSADAGPRIFTMVELQEVAAAAATTIARRASAGAVQAGGFAESLSELDDRARAARLVLLDDALEGLGDPLSELRFAARGLRAPRLDASAEAVEAARASLDAARTNLAVAASDRARVEALRGIERALAELREEALAIGATGPKTIVVE